ncbi:MAG: hypothetical protein A2V74_02470 [Acidobacteria bacterium RBG_16_70_10]|nr:MAG: hypothetical protein A2V74_02470 [Acidobacteria bacterium RBG_16_70_10]
MVPGADPEAVADEQRRAHQLRVVVDLTCAVLRQGRLRRAEAEELVAATRRRALELFPGKEDVFDLVLAPRFARLLEEFVRPRDGARVLPFRRR